MARHSDEVMILSLTMTLTRDASTVFDADARDRRLSLVRVLEVSLLALAHKYTAVPCYSRAPLSTP